MRTTTKTADTLVVSAADTAPKVLSWNGEEYPVQPLPDSAIVLIAETLNKPGGVFDTIIDRLTTVRTATGADGELVASVTFSASDLLSLLPALPQVVAALVPCLSKLVAAGFRLDEQKVANEMALVQKVDALRLILANEELPLLVQSFTGMVNMFRVAPDTRAAA